MNKSVELVLKLCKLHRKSPVLESIFNKIAIVQPAAPPGDCFLKFHFQFIPAFNRRVAEQWRTAIH